MHIGYMKRAIELAKRGEGRVAPNPLVGAVIVKDGEIIGEGYHKKIGGNHAEINAFETCKKDIRGGIMYVSLEPCSHQGRTPPCVDRIIKEGISEVYIGMEDPNPKVAGGGIKKLRENGIKVNLGILEEECRKLNKVFIKYIEDKKPYVVLKAGISMDGKIATKTGESMWITGEASRKHSHSLRNKYSAILVGIGTVLADDPRLTCRIENGINPIRIVVDSQLRIPLESKILKNQGEARTIIASLKTSDRGKKLELENLGIEVIELGARKGRVDLEELFIELGKREVDSILVEGGGTLNYSVLEANLVDKVYLYIAGRIIGGKNSKSFVGGEGIDRLSDSFNFNIENVQTMEGDILLEAYRKG